MVLAEKNRLPNLMGPGLMRTFAWAALALMASLASAQPVGSVAHCSSGPSGAEPKHLSLEATSEVIREIDDEATGDRWLLERDQTNPGAPGRMVRIESRGSDLSGGGNGAKDRAPAELRPVIHAGDKVIVEEHTAVVDARLEAVALASAAIGAEFTARLKIGGVVVRVVALAAGRARLASETEVQP